MRKKFTGLICGFVFIFILLLSLSFTSAKIVDYKEEFSVTKYYKDDGVLTVRKIYADYDNDDRFSTYDYRHGYSYRTSKDYWEKQHGKNIYLIDKGYRYKNNKDKEYWGDRYEYDNYYGKKKKTKCGQSKKRDYNYLNNGDFYEDYYDKYNKYGEYIPYLKMVKTKKCYNSPPKGKLFYIKC
tara:strand:- start:3298 stop:3843 length:546 start_codon:yes stop_codon:yes gene_type:complete